MVKKATSFYCKECGYETPKWAGKCPSCNTWNTIVDVPESFKSINNKSNSSLNTHSWTNATPTIKLSDAQKEEYSRSSTGINELDSVIGGGIPNGAVILIGGEPGIGKSTLLLQVADKYELTSKNNSIMYISGEESASQIASRAERLHVDKERIHVCTQTCFEVILDEITREAPALCIIDSIQTIFSDNVSGTPGSVSQAREVTSGFVRFAKSTDTPVILVGHITKDGNIAGPKTLEHMVDTVMYFENENLGAYRLLRIVKNRFGKSGEIVLFEMTESGLTPVNDCQTVLISGHPINVPGSALTTIVEGSKAIAIEIQALLTPTGYSNAQRIFTGLERNRVTILMAVADKYLNLNTPSYDAFINIVGGLKVTDPALDLAVIAAIVSSVRGIPVKQNTLILGEIGLSGEIRPVNQIEQRIRCAFTSGFETILLPSSCKKMVEKHNWNDKDISRNKNIHNSTIICDKIHSLEFVYVDNISEAIDVLFS